MQIKLNYRVNDFVALRHTFWIGLITKIHINHESKVFYNVKTCFQSNIEILCEEKLLIKMPENMTFSKKGIDIKV